MRSRTHTIMLLISGCLILVGCLPLTSLPNEQVLAMQPTPSDDDVNAIASELFCPVCENVPLDVCDSEACRQWRNLIREMLAQGKTADEIEMYFSENYGVRVLAEPPRSGFFWLAYGIPLLAILFGSIFLFKAMRKWRLVKNESKQDDEMIDIISDKYAERFENEFERIK